MEFSLVSVIIRDVFFYVTSYHEIYGKHLTYTIEHFNILISHTLNKTTFNITSGI
jgi:hypothetical protein